MTAVALLANVNPDLFWDAFRSWWHHLDEQSRGYLFLLGIIIVLYLVTRTSGSRVAKLEDRVSKLEAELKKKNRPN